MQITPQINQLKPISSNIKFNHDLDLKGLADFGVLAEYDQQLAELAGKIQSNLKSKQELRSEITKLKNDPLSQNLENFDSIIENKENSLMNLNDLSEHQTIQIQSVMEQRKIALTLISQMRSSHFETTKKITQNI